MTSDYRIILPLMVAVVFSTLVARRIFEPSIYTIKLIRKGIFLKAGKDIAILQASKVSEVMDTEFDTIPTNMPLVKIMETIESSKESNFVVLDRQERFVGILSMQHILGIITKHTLDYLIIAKDIASTDCITVCLDDDLEIAQKRFAVSDSPFIPVVNREDPSLILGVLRREAMVQYYNRKLIESFKQ